MTAMNVVHMRVKPGREADFIEAEKQLGQTEMPGLKKFSVVKTGDRQYIIVGEWEGYDAIVKARPAMIGSLDAVRDMLEDLGGGRGVTEPYSGDVVLELNG